MASTMASNLSNTPIAGIWCNNSIRIESAGYLPFKALVRLLWVDINYHTTFGHNMPAIVRPAMRRLQCIDPRSIDNFIRVYKKKIESKDLLVKAVKLEKKGHLPHESTRPTAV
jgi:hypothetical protein